MFKYRYFRKILCFFLLFVLTAFSPGAKSDSIEKEQFNYGIRLYQEKLYDLAALQFQSFVQNFKNSPDVEQAQYLLGESHFFSGQYDSAKKAFLDLMIIFPRSSRVAQAHFRLGECLEKQKKEDEAVEVYKQVYTRYPSAETGVEALFRAAGIQMSQMKYQSGVEAVQTILADKKSGEVRSKALILLGELYSRQNKYDDAIKTYNQLFSVTNPDQYKIEACFHLGDIYERIGYFGESESRFRKAAVSKYSELARQASFRLGRLMMLKDDYVKAISDFNNAIRSDDIYLKSKGLYWLANVYYHTGQYQDALTSVNNAYRLYESEENKCHALFLKGRILGAMKQLSEASAAYQILTAKNDKSPDMFQLKKLSLLHLAGIACQTGSFSEAISWYQKYLSLEPNGALSDIVRLQTGKLYFKHMNSLEEALQTFRQVWLHHPESCLVPEAKYYFAHCLLHANRHEEARNNYQSIIKTCPASVWADSAGIFIQKMDSELPVFNRNDLNRLAEYLLNTYPLHENVQPIFNLGKLTGEVFKNWTASINLFQDYLASKPDTSYALQAEYSIGLAYYHLYKGKKISAYRDSASFYLNKVYKNTLAGKDNIRAGLMMADLAAAQSIQKGVDLYKDILTTDPGDTITAQINERLAALYFAADSLGLAKNKTLELKGGILSHDYDEIILFRLGLIGLKQNNITQADSLFKTYLQKYPKGKYAAEIHIILAEKAHRLQQTDTALYWYERIRKHYPCSRYADSTALKIGFLYLKREEFNKALLQYQKMFDEDSIAAVAESAGLSIQRKYDESRILLGMAEANVGLKNYTDAKIRYFQLLRAYPDQHYRIAAYTGLARIAQQEESWERAVDYLNRLNQEHPSDSTGYELGMCYYRLKQYDKAVSVFDKAFQLAKKPEFQAVIAHRTILALLFQNQLSQADVRINLFNKSFRKVEGYNACMAEIILEKGRLQQRKKNFNLALDLFKDVYDDYKKTSFASEARLELGRTCLITNKTDEALDILTEMPERYPDQPVLAKVYLNLGDQYYRWQQFDNAIESFRKVINHFPDSEVTPLAMRYLIRVYDAVRMWDSALLLTRQYIAQYPDAEDNLQKKVQIGIFYFNLKDFILAANHLKNVLPESDPETEAEIQYWIGKSYYELGQFETAIYEFLKVKYIAKPTKLPWATTALYEAGQAYVRLKKPENAIKLFEKIIQTEGAASDLGRIAQQKINELKKQEQINGK